MALDAEYFDSIYIEVVKKKYYKAGKVQAVFEEIRRQAEALNAENRELRRQLAALDNRRVELGDTLLSAQEVYQDIIDRAKERAAAITAEAEQRAEGILAEARRQSEQLLAGSRDREKEVARRAEEAFQRMKELHLNAAAALDVQWQAFLDSLEQEPPAEREELPASETPGDLEEKVSAIAGELFSLEEEEQ